MQHPCITFTPEDITELHRLARLRGGNKSERSTNYFADKSKEQIHFKGLCGEAAISRYFQVPFVRSILPGGDKHGADTIIHGHTCEIKTSTHWPPILKFNRLDEFQSDIAILCYFKGETVEIASWVTYYEFRRTHDTLDFGYGPRLCI